MYGNRVCWNLVQYLRDSIEGGEATKTIESRRHAALTRRRFVSMGKAVTALQAAQGGMAERRQFTEIRKQVSAALIMNRNYSDFAPKSPPKTFMGGGKKIRNVPLLVEVEDESEEDEDL